MRWSGPEVQSLQTRAAYVIRCKSHRIYDRTNNNMNSDKKNWSAVLNFMFVLAAISLPRNSPPCILQAMDNNNNKKTLAHTADTHTRARAKNKAVAAAKKKKEKRKKNRIRIKKKSSRQNGITQQFWLVAETVSKTAECRPVTSRRDGTRQAKVSNEN